MGDFPGIGFTPFLTFNRSFMWHGVRCLMTASNNNTEMSLEYCIKQLAVVLGHLVPLVRGGLVSTV